jgi:hypothetical protein
MSSIYKLQDLKEVCIIFISISPQNSLKVAFASQLFILFALNSLYIRNYFIPGSSTSFQSILNPSRVTVGLVKRLRAISGLKFSESIGYFLVSLSLDLIQATICKMSSCYWMSLYALIGPMLDIRPV